MNDDMTLQEEARRLAGEYWDQSEELWGMAWHQPDQAYAREAALQSDQTARVLTSLAERVDWLEESLANANRLVEVTGAA